MCKAANPCQGPGHTGHEPLPGPGLHERTLGPVCPLATDTGIARDLTLGLNLNNGWRSAGTSFNAPSRGSERGVKLVRLHNRARLRFVLRERQRRWSLLLDRSFRALFFDDARARLSRPRQRTSGFRPVHQSLGQQRVR